MKDNYFILLRGVPGAGKSETAEAIKVRLGSGTVILDLDKYAEPTARVRFEVGLKQARGHKYVVGKLSSELWHTTDPAGWVRIFRDGYNMNSFVLDVSLDKGYRNCIQSSESSRRPPSKSEYKSRYDRFYQMQSENLFASRAQMNESRINAEDGDWNRISDQIVTACGIKPSEGVDLSSG